MSATSDSFVITLSSSFTLKLELLSLVLFFIPTYCVLLVVYRGHLEDWLIAKSVTLSKYYINK